MPGALLWDVYRHLPSSLGTPPIAPQVEALCHVLLGLFSYEGKTIITKNSKPVFYLETGFGQ